MMSESDSISTRRRIRTTCIHKRKALNSEEQNLLSEIICKNISDSLFFRNAETVLIYFTVNGEVSLAKLLSAPGKRFLFPYCLDKSTMISSEAPAGTVWKTGIFGIPEPECTEDNIFPPDQIDLVICPCSAFDSSCSRLGMGAGIYDRYLPQCTNAHIIAAAYEFQKVPLLPYSLLDVRMEAVFTEKRTYISIQKRRTASAAFCCSLYDL